MVKIYNKSVEDFCKSYRGEKFHALFCDAPYELNFMDKSWDSSGVAFNPDTWIALAEHLLPGAFLFVFAGTLNDDLISVAIRQAGLRKFHKTINWGFGSGFPKATNIAAQIDKASHVKRKIVGEYKVSRDYSRNGQTGDMAISNKPVHGRTLKITEPTTPLAKTWAGHRYGLQAIKPAAETILIFSKPYENNRAVDSIVKNGAGALNVDGGRIKTKAKNFLDKGRTATGVSLGWANTEHGEHFYDGSLGRWPANLLLQHSPDCNGTCSPDCAVAALDENSHTHPAGNKKDSPCTITREQVFSGGWKTQTKNPDYYKDTGGASRFFFNSDWSHEIQERIENADAVRYQAKASRRERNSGLSKPNNHPTVKPIALCKYLATLLLAPAEYAPRRILIPFSGSGSEAIGAMLAGWEEVVAVEKEKEYCEIGKARVKYWEKHREPQVKPTRKPEAREEMLQHSLF